MQKIVIDTNVFVSAIIQRGYSNLIVDTLFIEGKIQLCISDQVLEEYYSVLSRKKFIKYLDFVSKSENILAAIEAKSTWCCPKTKIDVIRDKDDNKFLELANESKANFLITGNTNDFTMKKFKKTFIVTPKEYWEKHKT